MIALSLQSLLFFLLLILTAIGLLAVTIDRRRFRDPLAAHMDFGIAELRPALNGAPFGVMLLNLQLECLYANDCACRLLGITPSQGKLPSTSWRPELDQDLTLVRRSDPPQSYYRVLNLSTEQTVSWWIYALPAFTLIILNDLSQQRHWQQTAHAFLGTLSHELRTPLAAILAHLEVVRGGNVADAVRQNSLTVIHQETNRLTHLVQGLLQLSRLETRMAFSQRPFDLLLVAEAAIAEVILTAESKNISISLEAEVALPRVLGDPDQLKQLFLNVLDNSINYCRPEDSVEVRSEKHPAGICVTIADNGPGILPEHLPHITERLYRGRTDVPGSGLGLAIATEILRHHDSQLEIESRAEGKKTGVTIRFLLPIASSG